MITKIQNSKIKITIIRIIRICTNLLIIQIKLKTQKSKAKAQKCKLKVKSNVIASAVPKLRNGVKQSLLMNYEV